MEVTKGKLYGVVTGDVVASSKLGPSDRELLFAVMKQGSRELRDWLGPEAMPLEVDIYGGDSWQMLLATPGKSLAAALFFRAFLRAHPPHCDSRFAVAIGPIDFVPGGNVSEGDGDAFRRSGQMLEGALGKRRMGFAPPSLIQDTQPFPSSSAPQSIQDTQPSPLTKQDTQHSHRVVEPPLNQDTQHLPLPGVSQSKQDTQPLAASGVAPTPSWDLVYEILDAVATRWSDRQALAITGALRGWTQDETGKLWHPAVEQPTVNRSLKSASWPVIARAVEEFEQGWSV